MPAVKAIELQQLKAICETLGDLQSDRQISDTLRMCGLVRSEGSNKGARLFRTMAETQAKIACSNKMLEYITRAMDPIHYTTDRHAFETMRDRLNAVLSFAGFHVGEDGKVVLVASASTLSEGVQIHLRGAASSIPPRAQGSPDCPIDRVRLTLGFAQGIARSVPGSAASADGWERRSMPHMLP